MQTREGQFDSSVTRP
nr:unnamed protein product [Callosobruchus chinensis]